MSLFPCQCFVRGGLFAATSLNRSNKIVLLYDKARGTSARLAIPTPQLASGTHTHTSRWSSMSVAAAGNGHIAVLLSSPLSVPPVLAVGKVAAAAADDGTHGYTVEWTF